MSDDNLGDALKMERNAALEEVAAMLRPLSVYTYIGSDGNTKRQEHQAIMAILKKVEALKEQP